MTKFAGNPLVHAVGRTPFTVQRKLLVAFIGMVALLMILGVLGLRALSESNDRVAALAQLPQRAAAYRELQIESGQLSHQLNVRDNNLSNPGPTGPMPPSSADITAWDGQIDTTLRQLGIFTVIANLGFVPPPEERSILTQIHSEYVRLYAGMLIILVNDAETDNYASNQPETDEATALERNADQLVSITQRATANLTAQNQSSYLDSQHLFIGVAAGSIVLALLLGVLLSRALIGPIRKVNTRLAGIASGDFSSHVDVTNRDELGVLATNLNRMNDELGRLYRELEAASQHKSEFLANMSHELRTPLNAIIGFSEVLQDRLFGDINEKQAEYLADIHTSGRHLLALINDILDLSKIEAGRMELQVSSFSLSELLENSLALMRERATRQQISLKLEVDPSIGVIDSDERKLKQVLSNLLTNAVKFTAAGGHVDVSARSDGDGVVVSVRDDGVGIAPDDQTRIFGEFEQAGTSHLQEGTGLGLALSRRFIELVGGRLRVESEPGHGSTFTFNLPRTMVRAHAEGADAIASHLSETALPSASPVA